MPLGVRGARQVDPQDSLDRLLKYVSTLHGGPPRFVNPLLERANRLLPVVRVCPSVRSHLPPTDVYEQAIEELNESDL